jgi:DNA-binding transcriptional regulator YiaG
MITPETIRAIRAAMDLSPTAFATKLKVSEATIHRWENGKSHPRWSKQQKLDALRKKLGIGFVLF